MVLVLTSVLKDEISLGEGLTIRLAEADVKRDPRSIERILVDTLFTSTKKFDETPQQRIDQNRYKKTDRFYEKPLTVV